MGLINENDYLNYLRLVFGIYEKKIVYYIPHRKETLNKLEKIKNIGYKIKSIEIPFEMWYKSVHYLNKDNQIERIERFSKYDFTNISKDEIEKWKTEWAPELRIEKPNPETMLQVDYFYHSFGKMNGIYPVSENFKLNEAHYYYGDEPEKTSILNGIKN